MSREITKPHRTKAGRRIIAGLKELERGLSGDAKARASWRINQVEIPDPAEYGPADVRALRASLGASQTVFAKLVGVSVQLVEHWEQGIREPAPLARRLFDEMRYDPAGYLARRATRRTVLA